VFVDKFLNRLAIGRMKFETLHHLSGQMILLSVVCSAMGVCKSIVRGRMLGEILPFYIVSFLGLYVYFSVASIVDIGGKKRMLKINLVDYLENHLASQIHVTKQDIQMLYGTDRMQETQSQEKEKQPERKENTRYAGAAEERAESEKGGRYRNQQQGVQSGFTKEQELELEKLLLEFLT